MAYASFSRGVHVCLWPSAGTQLQKATGTFILIVKQWLQHGADGVVRGICAQYKPSVPIHEVHTSCGQQRLLHSLKGMVGLFIPDQIFLDPFLVSSRLPLSMAVIEAAYSAYILIYLE